MSDGIDLSQSINYFSDLFSILSKKSRKLFTRISPNLYEFSLKISLLKKSIDELVTEIALSIPRK